uniref:BMERB domain-containing protein n=1 Tax=Salvator merianae TaxID=96440 RepID=A0A8D0CDC8_SALMN
MPFQHGVLCRLPDFEAPPKCLECYTETQHLAHTPAPAVASILTDTNACGPFCTWLFSGLYLRIGTCYPLASADYSRPQVEPAIVYSKAIFLSKNNNFMHSLQLTGPNKIPEITKGHINSQRPAFQIKGKAQDKPEEIPSYIPHYSLYNGTDRYPLGERDGTASAHAKEQHDRYLNKAKSKIIRKLTLSMEQQSKLQALNDTEQGGTRTVQPNHGIPDQKNACFRRYDNIPKQSTSGKAHNFSDNHVPILSPENKLPKNVNNCPKEHTVAQPKSPLRLIANAIKKSIIEPLTSPDGLKKGPGTNTSLASENTFFSFPQAVARSVNLRNKKSHGDHNEQVPDLSLLDSSEKRHELRSLGMGHFSGRSEDEYSCGNKGTPLPVYCAPGNSSTEHCINVDEVPTLLERFTLKERLQKYAKGDLHDQNEKNVLYSSLRHRNKSADVILKSPEQRSNRWDLFSNFRNKIDGKMKAPISPCTVFDVDDVLNDSSKEEYLEVSDDYSSSSDGELGSKTSLFHKVTFLSKRTIRRNRRLEKETKQLAKQEELKRFHKAQAIQRLLEEVEEKQRALEVYGVQLERELRGESDSRIQDETQLLQEWFELVLEKNKLMHYESKLLIIERNKHKMLQQLIRGRRNTVIRLSFPLEEQQVEEKDEKKHCAKIMFGMQIVKVIDYQHAIFVLPSQ